MSEEKQETRKFVIGNRVYEVRDGEIDLERLTWVQRAGDAQMRRRGEFTGSWMPLEIKEQLRIRAARWGRSVSKEIFLAVCERLGYDVSAYNEDEKFDWGDEIRLRMVVLEEMADADFVQWHVSDRERWKPEWKMVWRPDVEKEK